MFNIRYGFSKKLPKTKALCLAPEQTHSALVTVLNSKSSLNYAMTEIPKVDGLIYQISSPTAVCLSVKTADCLPILLYEQKAGIMAVVHMGYRGAYLGILDNLMKQLLSLPIDLDRLRVRFGPSINGACYNIPMTRFEQFAQRFDNNPLFLFRFQQNYFLSLTSFAFYYLRRLKIPRANFQWQLYCTHCQRKQFYSFRRGDRHHNQYSYLIYEA